MWKHVSSVFSKPVIDNSFLGASNILFQQTRNTYVLKRKWPPGLHKKNAAPKVLRGRNYVYDIEEIVDMRKKQPLDIILTTYVEGLGGKGDIVQVKPLFAYNKLLLPKLGVYKTPENIAKYVDNKVTDVRLLEHSSRYAPKTINALRYLCLQVTMNKDTPWTIEPWHIRASFRKVGYHVAEDAIKLSPKPISGPDLTLESKEFFVTVTINNFESTPVRCRLHHWSTVPSERLPYVFEFWKKAAKPIFPEDAEILNSLPSYGVEEKPEVEEY